MRKKFRNIKPEDVFFIFNEEHRLCSQFDPEADPTAMLTMNSSVREWSDARDLLPWKKLAKYLNKEFEIDISESEWKSVLVPSRKRTLYEVCKLISDNAKQEVIEPVTIFGNECLSASVFKTIKNKLALNGVNVINLTPSSSIKPILNKNFGEFIEVINKNFTGVLPELKFEGTNKIKKEIKGNTFGWSSFMIMFIGGFIWYSLWFIALLIIFLGLIDGLPFKYKFEETSDVMIVPGIETYRDLVERIVERDTPCNRVGSR